MWGSGMYLEMFPIYFYCIAVSNESVAKDPGACNKQTTCFHFLMFPHPRPYTSSLVIQPLSRVQLFVTPWTAAYQASLSFTLSWSLFRLMSIESGKPSSHPPSLHLSPLAFNLSQHQGLFQWAGYSHHVAKVLELQLQHQCFQ